jgi:hypothetical protein
MFSILVKLAVAAVAVSAYEPCEPVTPSSTSSSAGPGPTNPGGVTTLTQRGKCVDLQAANYNDGTVVQM